MNPKAIFELFRDAFKDWNEDKAARLGASLAYYTIFSLGPLLVVSLVVSAGVAALGAFLKSVLPGGDLFAQVVNFIITLGVITAMFALLFKYLPDIKIAWKDVWIGSLVTALLFLIGQFALSFY